MTHSLKAIFVKWCGLTVALMACTQASAQSTPTSLPDAPQPQPRDPEAITLRHLPRDIGIDQRDIWTSPRHLGEPGSIVPILLIASTALIATEDRQMMNTHVPTNASLNSHASTASDGLVGGFLLAPVVFYGMGHRHGDEHARETGILAAESILDGMAVNQVAKLAAMRERPDVDGNRGRFFQTSAGFDSSFPSNHAVIAWSSASAISAEYDGWLTKIVAYGLAGGVSASRVLGRDHFPSDVWAASGLGWMIGRYVVHRHERYHD